MSLNQVKHYSRLPAPLPGLMPVEHWEYGILDFARGIVGSFSSGKPEDAMQIPGLGSCTPARSARAALVAAIRALDLPAGAKVGVPLYCCPVVFKAVIAAGCSPCFIDVERSTCCMSPEDLYAKRLELEAVIGVHMFGHLCDIHGLQRAAPSIPVIEDCAQSLGSVRDNCSTGSSGLMAVFSFRSGKYLSVGEGGALFTREPRIHSRVLHLLSAMPQASRSQECAHVASTYVRSRLRGKALYGILGYPLWSVYNRTVGFEDRSPVTLGQIYRSDLELAQKRLDLIDSVIARQRSNADFYSRALCIDSGLLFKEEPGAFYNRYMYPIVFNSSEGRDFMSSYLRKRKIETGKPYSDIVQVATMHYGYGGGCPISEQIARGVLTIPVHHALKRRDLLRVVQHVNAGWTSFTDRVPVDGGGDKAFS